MRTMLALAVAVVLSAAPVFAQSPENELQKLKAEVERLRAENARLKFVVEEFSKGVKAHQESRDEHQKFEGNWAIEIASMNGEERTREKGAELEFSGNRVFMRVPGRKETIRVEVGIFPSVRQINFGHLPGTPGATETALDLVIGIYELKGDTLRISLQSAYTIPEEISDEGQVLWVLKRKKS